MKLSINKLRSVGLWHGSSNIERAPHVFGLQNISKLKYQKENEKLFNFDSIFIHYSYYCFEHATESLNQNKILTP